VEKKIIKYLENNYPGWVLKMKKTGVYLEFVSKHSNPNLTPEVNFTNIDQEFQNFNDNLENLN